MSDGYSVSLQVGRVAASEPDLLWMPRTPRRKVGVICGHMYLAPLGYVDATAPNSCSFPALLAASGIICISGQFGNSDALGSNWANDQAMSRVTAAWSVLQGLGCSASKVNLFGISMGAATAMRYAMLNPSSVGAVYGIAPVSDLTDVYVNSRVSNAHASVGTAWGVTYPAALPSGADLPGQAHLASAIPCQLDYGTADATVISSTVTTLAAAWGSKCTATATDSTHGHNDLLIGSTDPANVLRFFAANGS